MAAHRYYTLVSSLPALPRIGVAERLPLNAARLEERLRMLLPGDAATLAEVRRFIAWQDRPAAQTDADIAADYDRLMAGLEDPVLREVVAHRTDIRTVMAALRRRRRGETDGPADTAWGAGRWVRHIESHWTHPDFRLAQVFPWLPEAREELEAGRALPLQERLMTLVWDALDRSTGDKFFQFENVVAFVFKWDILARWLSYERDAARARFEEVASAIAAASPTPAPST